MRIVSHGESEGTTGQGTMPGGRSSAPTHSPGGRSGARTRTAGGRSGAHTPTPTSGGRTRTAGGRSTAHIRTPGGRIRWRFAMAFALAWLVVLVRPILEAFSRGTAAGRLGAVALIVFALAYGYAVRGLRQVFRGEPAQPRTATGVTVGLMAVCAVLATVALGPAGLVTAPFLAVVGPVLLHRFTVLWVFGFAAAAELLTYAMVGDWSSNLGVATETLSAGLLVWVFALLVQQQHDQLAARDAQAQISLIEERNRFSRDLHDILGHSLTAIAIRSELATRLVEHQPDRARTVMAQVEHLAREALEDIRRAVEGYREITLIGELSRAREALDSADITAHIPSTWEPLPREVENLFAWAVREAVTNVLRHSGAKKCTIHITPTSVTIGDDGRGLDASDRHGAGLNGLRERAIATDSVLLLDTAPGAGCRVTVRRRSAGGAQPAGDEV